MIYEAKKEEILKFRVDPPLFCPFYNIWGEYAYDFHTPFSLDPFKLPASSTSGSPVVLSRDSFFGFLNDCGGSFSFDGSCFLTVTLQPGAKLYVSEHCAPMEEWKAYNRHFEQEKKTCAFWSDLEYCTWVEQSKQAALSGKTNSEVMSEDFVYQYIERIKKMSYPRGKFTIDDGWMVDRDEKGNYYLGDWEIDRKKFPHFEQLIADLKKEEFIPGLWLAPFTATKNSKLIREHPELLGAPYSAERNWYNLLPREDILTDHYRRIFEYYAGLGFMKFKLDISYGPKNDMIRILKLIYGIIKDINPDIEVETHMPDIFATRYADTVRINDVSFDAAGKWRSVVSGHYVVCKNSSPDRILNLDHIGTNASLSSAENYLEHCGILLEYAKESGGYPVISYLPDIFPETVWKEVRERILTLYDASGARREQTC